MEAANSSCSKADSALPSDETVAEAARAEAARPRDDGASAGRAVPGAGGEERGKTRPGDGSDDEADELRDRTPLASAMVPLLPEPMPRRADEADLTIVDSKMTNMEIYL